MEYQEWVIEPFDSMSSKMQPYIQIGFFGPYKVIKNVEKEDFAIEARFIAEQYQQEMSRYLMDN